MRRERYYLIADIGMTKTTNAVFTEDGELLEGYTEVVSSRTGSGAEAVYRNTADGLWRMLEHFRLDKEQILGIGVGAPGPLDVARGVIIDSPMMGVKDFPLVSRLSAEFGLPAVMDNDGNLGALAEARRGRGKGMKHVLYLTVSTGCGGGAVLNGQVYRGAHDGAAEFGHISIDPKGPACPCGNHGCLEMLASGTAIGRRMEADRKNGAKSLAFALADQEGRKVRGEDLTRAAAAGDPYALELYRREGYYLGSALAVLFNCFDPDVFVLGGGVTKARSYFQDEMVKTLQERAIMQVDPGRIQYSEMNDLVVVYGAYYLIREYLEGDRSWD